MSESLSGTLYSVQHSATAWDIADIAFRDAPSYLNSIPGYVLVGLPLILKLINYSNDISKVSIRKTVDKYNH